jgi:hypothetical protein
MAHLATAATDAGIDLGKLMIEVTESALAPSSEP